MLIVGHDLGAASTDLITVISDHVAADLGLMARGSARLDLNKSLVEPDQAFRDFFDMDGLTTRLGVAQFLQFLPEENRHGFLSEFERYVSRSSAMYVLAPSKSGVYAMLYFPAVVGQTVVKAQLYALESAA